MKKKRKLIGIMKIKSADLYFPYKPKQEEFYKKFFHWEADNPLWFYNTPIFLFAQEYAKIRRSILDHIQETAFIQYIFERYKVPSKKKKAVALENATRLMNLFDSIKKHGYAKGKFDKPSFLINIIRGSKSPYLMDKSVYTLYTHKHRAAACLALGMKRIRVKVYR